MANMPAPVASLFPLRPRTAAILYSVFLALSIAVVAGQGELGNAILQGAYILLLSCGWIGLCCRKCTENRPYSGISPVDASVGPSSADPSPPPRPTVRLHFLDNLRTVLTALVVAHHTGCAFTGAGWNFAIGAYRQDNSFWPFSVWFLTVNQSYFMVLYFFISGYFSAGSLGRKGASEFLLDRFRRLLVPLFFVLFVVWPSIGAFVFATNQSSIVAGKDEGKMAEYRYIPAVGHAWFLLWLLVFSVGYAGIAEPTSGPSAEEEPEGQNGADRYTLPAPSPAGLLCRGFGLGVLLGVLIAIMRSGTFVSMPLTIGSLTLDVAAFALGARSGCQGWLRGDFFRYYFGPDCGDADDASGAVEIGHHAVPSHDPEMHDGEAIDRRAMISDESDEEMYVHVRQNEGTYFRRRVLLFAATTLSAAFCYLAVLAAPDPDAESEGDKKEEGNNENTPTPTAAEVLFFLLGFGIFGIICIIFCSWWLVVAKLHLDFSSPWLKWMSRASYGVYIIHPLVVNVTTVLYVVILDAMQAARDGGKILFEVKDTFSIVSPTELKSDIFLWAGWILATAVNVVLSWIVAGAMRCIPGLETIL